MQCDHLGSQEILAIWETAGNGDGMLSRIVDHIRGTPGPSGKSILLNLEPKSLLVCRSDISYILTFTHQPFPTPESLVASSTFFRYAIVGPR